MTTLETAIVVIAYSLQYGSMVLVGAAGVGLLISVLDLLWDMGSGE
jgi:hypothetical protein